MIPTLGAIVVTGGVVGLHAVFVVFVLLRPRVRQPSSLAWILVIIAVPFGGIVLYLIVGEVRTGSRRKRRHRTIQRNIRTVLRHAWHETTGTAVVPWGTEAIARLARLGSETQPRNGNRLGLVATAERFTEALVDDIESARDHVHLLFFIYLDDKVGTYRRRGPRAGKSTRRPLPPPGGQRRIQ